MMKIGLTGGIGSGKSFIAQIFAQLGVPVYNSDERAKSLMLDSDLLVEQISTLLGSKAYINGEIDRKYISNIVFSDPDKLNQLNNIVHPAVGRDFNDWYQKQIQIKVPFVIKEAAILFESGAYKTMDKSILVTAPEELRIKRVVNRDGVTEEDVQKRLQNQMPTEKVMPLADYIIDNNGKKLILPQLIEIYKKIIT